MASTELRAAAQQALEFIRWSQFVPCQSEPFPKPPLTAPQVEAALRAALAEEALQRLTDVSQEIEAALAEPVQEPVAWIDNSGHPKHIRHLQSVTERRLYGPLRPLFAAPPQRTLTDEVIAELWHQNGGFHHHFARAIERWLRGHA